MLAEEERHSACAQGDVWTDSGLWESWALQLVLLFDLVVQDENLDLWALLFWNISLYTTIRTNETLDGSPPERCWRLHTTWYEYVLVGTNSTVPVLLSRSTVTRSPLTPRVCSRLKTNPRMKYELARWCSHRSALDGNKTLLLLDKIIEYYLYRRWRDFV